MLADPRFVLRCVALALLLASLAVPPLPTSRTVYSVLAVLDITGSMNVRDQRLGGAAASRITMEKQAVRRLLARLPCGSRLGLAVFVERQPFLLFQPVEACANFAPLDQEIGAVDWRMGWDSESHIAEALIAAIPMAAGLDADLVFMTDGQETPPLAWSVPPDFGRVRGRAHGVIEGVGGAAFSPIPKFDAYGREIGTFQPGDVPSEQFGLFRGREHLSAVDEPHLRSLADATGLGYRHLDGEDALFADLGQQSKPRSHPGTLALGWICAGLALILLIAAAIPSPRGR